jgi:hypothetical protein
LIFDQVDYATYKTVLQGGGEELELHEVPAHQDARAG